MRFRQLEASDEGEAYRLWPEDREDMWTIYNLIETGDRVRASSFRKVAKGLAGTSTDRVRVNLTIKVAHVSFDADVGFVRVSGKTDEENEYVRKGAFHTLDLEPNMELDIQKPAWDAEHERRIREAADVSGKAEIVAVVMDVGLANVCLVTQRMTLVRAKIERSVPRKRGGVASGEAERNKFFADALAALLRHGSLATVKAVVIASPGFVREEFYRYMLAELDRRGASDASLKPLASAKASNKIILAHAPSGHAHALQAAFADPAVAARLSDTKAAAEVVALAALMRALHVGPGADSSSGASAAGGPGSASSEAGEKAFYGYRHVRHAADVSAVEQLLISDALFRSANAEARKAFVALAQDVEKDGGSVLVFSAMHPSGEQLAQLSGVACLCRFPVAGADEASAHYAALARDLHRATAAHGSGFSSAAAATPGGAAGTGGSAASGGAGGAADGLPITEATSAARMWDSDASSDSDASYKKV